MFEAGALAFAMLGGGVLGCTFAETWFGPGRDHELRFVVSGTTFGTFLVTLAILLLPLP
jgi:hypothetical protein